MIGTTSSQEKAEIAKKAGASHMIIYTNDDVPAAVSKLTNGKGVAVVFDGVGKTTFDASLQCLGFRGALLTYGQASGKVKEN